MPSVIQLIRMMKILIRSNHGDVMICRHNLRGCVVCRRQQKTVDTKSGNDRRLDVWIGGDGLADDIDVFRERSNVLCRSCNEIEQRRSLSIE